MVDGRANISSFDHQQTYGLSAPIDAVKRLQEILCDTSVKDAALDRKTGDLLFEFGERIVLQVFNFTSYEIWQLHFPGGAVEYSNQVSSE